LKATDNLRPADPAAVLDTAIPHIALVGQPNCGKSTIFNSLAGFKANTGNFAGTSVEFTESVAMVGGRRVRLTDLPGTYSLVPSDEAEGVTRHWLDSGAADAVILVLDASVLSRSLELALELSETEIPFVVALNMMDDAGRKGISIDAQELSRRLGVPVVPTVATRGQGVVQVVMEALVAASRRIRAHKPAYDRDVDAAVESVRSLMPAGLDAARQRYLAVRVLEGDPVVEAELARFPGDALERARAVRRRLAADHGWSEDSVFSSHRHAIAVNLFEAVSRVVRNPGRPLGERVDAVLMNPVLGPLAALAAIAGFFALSFFAGGALSGLVMGPFEALGDSVRAAIPGVAGAVVRGLVDGLGGGMAIVLPYLLPLLFVMALLEDIGYLPRAAFLVDGLLHRIGLHGKSAIPLIMGYGCNVPAIMGARALESRRDRLLTVLITPFIPCSARTVVILALVGAVFGVRWVIALYILNILVASGVGRLLSSMVPGESVGLLMDIPPYRVPPVRAVAAKVWFRTKSFLLSAWPALIAATILMALLEHWGIQDQANRLLAPFTAGLLGLPEAVGVTLIFGIFRKELTLLMLFSALGTTDVASVMSATQIMTFVVFVIFYVPCVATIITQVRETGWKWTGVSVLLNTIVATVLAGLIRIAGSFMA